MSAVGRVIEPSNLRAELTEGILAVWHKGREYYLRLGRLLIEARQKLSAPDFNAMIEDDLPFGYDNARRFMRIAADPRIATLQKKGPDSFAALDELRRLNDLQFEAAIASGQIHEELTVKEARAVVRECLHPETPDTGNAWRAIARELHRPRAKYPAPCPPAAAGAQTVSELVYLLRERRKAVGLSQAALDDRIGWAEGLCSKYEIPHEDEGRKMSLDALCEACQALGVGIALVGL